MKQSDQLWAIGAAAAGAGFNLARHNYPNRSFDSSIIAVVAAVLVVLTFLLIQRAIGSDGRALVFHNIRSHLLLDAALGAITCTGGALLHIGYLVYQLS